ncbi:MAG: divalent-cation tolerance protein CutA [Nocardioides sp.]
MTGSNVIEVWINCPTRASAHEIATSLVGSRLAAAVNIGAEHTSYYVWQGTPVERNEFQLRAKTLEARFDELAAHVQSIHPYEVPSIVAVSLNNVDPSYGRWVGEATAK